MPVNDILNCDASELWAILDSEDGYEGDRWFMCKGVGMIELCKLGEMLDVGAYDDLIGQFDLVGEPRDEGPWPQTLPGALIERLASISDDEIASVVPQWLTIDELQGSATAEFLTEYLTGLRTYLSAKSGEFYLVNAL